MIFENIIEFIIPTSEIIINSIATIIVTIIFLCIYIRYMRGKLKNLISTKNLKFALILIIPSFITVLFNIVSNVIEGSLDFSYLIILVGITAPFIEEVIFRGFIISNLMRIKKSKNLSIVWAVEIGLATVIFHIVLILIQLAILRKKFGWRNILQLPI